MSKADEIRQVMCERVMAHNARVAQSTASEVLEDVHELTRAYSLTSLRSSSTLTRAEVAAVAVELQALVDLLAEATQKLPEHVGEPAEERAA